MHQAFLSIVSSVSAYPDPRCWVVLVVALRVAPVAPSDSALGRCQNCHHCLLVPPWALGALCAWVVHGAVQIHLEVALPKDAWAHGVRHPMV